MQCLSCTKARFAYRNYFLFLVWQRFSNSKLRQLFLALILGLIVVSWTFSNNSQQIYIIFIYLVCIFHIKKLPNCCWHKYDYSISQKFQDNFWRVSANWPNCAPHYSTPKHAESTLGQCSGARIATAWCLQAVKAVRHRDN